MKKILLILLLFISIASIGQDQYYRVVDWKFIPDSVTQLSDTTYIMKASPIDFNDPGAIERTIGNYVVDFVGHRFLVIDSTSTTITVEDEYNTGRGPQSGRTARCYRSVGGGLASYVGSVDYSPLDESARWKLNGADNELLWDELGQPYDSILFNKDISTIPITPYAMYADTTDRTISIALGNDVVAQLNQESLLLVINNTSDTIKNGKICYGAGIVNGYISIALASKKQRYTALLMATEDIPPGKVGFGVSIVGKVRGINTSGLSLGPIRLDENGDAVNITQQFPDYDYQIGVVTKVHPTDGVIQFKSDGINFYNSIRNIMDGSIRETFDFRTFSDGTDVYGVLSNPSGDTTLTLVFSTGWYDYAVPDTFQLIEGPTKGPGVNPEMNYIYIDEATRTPQISTSGYPVTEHAKISTTALFDAASTQSDGSIRNQNINDHFKSDDDNGHILHMAERIRVLNAAWESGVATTLTGTPTNLYFQTTSGNVWQMHLQSFPAQDMTTGDDIHVVNDPDIAYRTTTNLNDITEFSDGTAWNNEWSNIVLWGVCNKTGELSHIMVNLPSDGYQQEESAIADALNYTNYTIPREFRGVGFLIGRFTIRRSGTNFSYNPSVGYLDLRGFVPNSTAGGGAGGSTPISSYLQLDDTPNTAVALAFQRWGATATALENVLAEDILLTEFDSTGFTLDQSQVVGYGDFPDNGFSIFNNIDPTKIANFDASNITTGTTRTYTFPDVSDTIAVLGDLDTVYTKIVKISHDINQEQIQLSRLDGNYTAFMSIGDVNNDLSIRNESGAADIVLEANVGGVVQEVLRITSDSEVLVGANGTSGSVLKIGGNTNGQLVLNRISDQLPAGYVTVDSNNDFQIKATSGGAEYYVELGGADVWRIDNSGNGDLLGDMTSTQYNINDANTYITEDGSSNMAFTDAVTGTKTLAELAADNTTNPNGRIVSSGTSITLTTTDYTVVNNTTASKMLFPASSASNKVYILINRNPSGSIQLRNSTDTANQNYNTPSGIASTIAASSIVQLQLIGGVWYQIGN